MIISLGPSRERPGFYYGWVILGLSTLCIFFAAGLRSLYAVFYLAQVGEFGWSRGAGSLPYATTLIVMVCGTPLVGALLDRWGPRVMFSFAQVLIAAGFALGIYVREPWHLAVTFGLIAGVGFTTNAMLLHGAVLSRWFSRRRGLAIGIASAGFGLAQSVLSPLAQGVIGLWGWRAAYLLLAGVTLALAPLLFLFYRPDPASVGQTIDADGGAPPPKRAAGGRRRKRRTMEIRDPEWAATDWTLRRAWRTRAFYGVLGISLFQSYAFHVVGVHGVAILVQSGFERAAAAALYGVIGLGLTAGLFFWGSFSDRVGREVAYSLGTLFAIAGFAGLGLLTPAAGPAAAWVCVLVLGLGMGSRPTLFSLIAVDIFQGKQAGLIMGIASAGVGIGGTIGSVSAGMLYDRTGSYAPAIALCIVTLLLSAVSAWIAGPSRIRKPVVRKEPASGESANSLARYSE